MLPGARWWQPACAGRAACSYRPVLAEYAEQLLSMTNTLLSDRS
jgi:hypothetical protein